MNTIPQIKKVKETEGMRNVRRYLKENEVLLKRYKLIMSLVINFPRRFKIPFLSKVALWIVRKQGGQLDIQFSELNKK